MRFILWESIGEYQRGRRWGTWFGTFGEVRGKEGESLHIDHLLPFPVHADYWELSFVSMEIYYY
jgi:hypothetical protein